MQGTAFLRIGLVDEHDDIRVLLQAARFTFFLQVSQSSQLTRQVIKYDMKKYFLLQDMSMQEILCKQSNLLL